MSFLINPYIHSLGGVSYDMPPIETNLQLYFNPDVYVYSDYGSTLANHGDNIVQQNDLSGNGNNITQSTGGLQPLYDTSTLGGGNASIHRSATKILNLDSTVSLTNSESFTVYAVYKRVSGTAWNSAIGGATNESAVNLRSGYSQIYDTTGYSRFVTDQAYTTNLEVRAWVIDRTAVTFSAYLNNSFVASTGLSRFAGMDFTSLYGQGTDTGLDIHFGIVLLYDSAHDSSDVSTIKTWLNSKYSIY